MKRFFAGLLVFSALASFVACKNTSGSSTVESSSPIEQEQIQTVVPGSTGATHANTASTPAQQDTIVSASTNPSAPKPTSPANITSTAPTDQDLKNLKITVTINDELYWWDTATTYADTVAELLDEMEDIDFLLRHLTNKTILCVKGVWANGINHWDIYYSGEKIDSSPESVRLQTEMQEFRLNLVKPKGDEKQYWIITGGKIIYYYVSDYDFADWTPFNITLDEWNSWDAVKKAAFRIYDDKFGEPSEWTFEQRRYYQWVTYYNGYSCGAEGHICKSEEYHNALMGYIDDGCPHCGSNECPCLLTINEYDLTWPDYTRCPQYDVHNDPTVYCQTCGLIRGGYAESGKECCIKANKDITCSWCGKEMLAGECHQCTKP